MNHILEEYIDELDEILDCINVRSTLLMEMVKP